MSLIMERVSAAAGRRLRGRYPPVHKGGCRLLQGRDSHVVDVHVGRACHHPGDAIRDIVRDERIDSIVDLRGARFVTAGHSYRTYDWPDATGAVDGLLATYNLADELARKH